MVFNWSCAVYLVFFVRLDFRFFLTIACEQSLRLKPLRLKYFTVNVGQIKPTERGDVSSVSEIRE